MNWRPAGLPTLQLRTWLPETKTTWRIDLIAGLTLWTLVVPEAIAYASLAGLPPASGIWALIMLLPMYALWGASRYLVASPTSALAVTMGGLIISINAPDPRQAAAAVSLIVAVVFLLGYFLRLGFLVHFVSEPINSGFMFGIAVFVVISQLHKILGVDGADGTAVDRLVSLIGNLGSINWVTVGLSLLALLLMMGVPRLSPKIPSGLLMIALMSGIVAVFGLRERFHVATAGKIETGIPDLVAPTTGAAPMSLVIMGAAGMALLAYSEATGVARSIATARGEDYNVNRDMFPLGVGNLLSGLVGGLAGGGSMTSSSANEDAGARTQLAPVVAAAAALVTVMFFGNAVVNLPEAALGVLVIVAVRHHLSPAFYRKLSRFSRAEALIAALAAAGVLFLGVLNGLLLAMGTALVWFLVRSTSVNPVTIGQSRVLPTTLVSEDSPDYQPLPNGVVGRRFGGVIFYGNIERVTDVVREAVTGNGTLAEPEYHAVIVDLAGQDFIDYTTVTTALQVTSTLHHRGVWVVLTNLAEASEKIFQDAAGGKLPENLILLHNSDLEPVTDQLAGPPSAAK